MNSFKKIFFLPILFSILLLTACELQENAPIEANLNNGTEPLLTKQYNLPRYLMQELQQAKSATGRYNNIANALDDGYIDINVVVPHMGHHYLNPNYVEDGIFEITKPEILVYSPHPVTGNMRLVAVEYAVPISFPEPDGFTGDYDVWDYNTTFELWLLHAWVWEYNPDGVFAPMNPNVP